MTRLRPQIHNGLHWVRGELDQSLSRARNLIENHAENRGDPLPLQQSFVELHQVRGTASMIQCFGVAAAADEMKQTVHELMNGRIAESDVAYSVLLGATVQLSDYIEALASGLDDCALVLQPMLNELRLARGKNVLTEMDLFAGQLGALNLPLPAPDADSRLPGASQAQAQKLLTGFQRALLEWFKYGEAAPVAVARMGKTAEQIAINTRSAPLYLMWRCFAACAEAMLARNLETSFELKRLFGSAGRQIKVLAEQGEDAAAAQLGELPYQLLFFVGRSRGQGPRVSGLRKVFSLDTYLPQTAQLEELRRKLKGPGAGLLTKVADEIRNDLGQVKDSIDLAVRGGKGAPTLADTRARLKRIADTLTVLGLQVLQRVVTAQARSLESVPDGQPVAPELWMEIATALLRVESSLEGALFRAIVRQRLAKAVDDNRPELEEETPAPRDLREGRAALLRESLVNLARLKAGVDAYLKRGESTGLVEAARMLSEISAGFAILQSARAAGLVAQLDRYVRSEAFAALRESADSANRFADAIACVEYYVESVRDELPDAERILDDLAGFIEQLDLQPEAPAAEPVELRVAAPDEPPPEPVPAPQPVADEVDPEIRDIFVEEAGEVRSTLEDALPRWTRDPGNKEVIGVLRRAFHTLKGSGRMVGAKDIGEFGWAVENMLNRCLDGAIPTGASVTEVVQQAVSLLPSLIDSFRDSQPVPAELAPLVARAQALASGQDGDAEPDMAAIFREDAREKLAATTAWLAGIDRSSIETRADQDAIRAFHTIKGSAAVVNARAISELAGALETWLESVGSASVPLSAEALGLLDEACAQLLAWVAAAGTPAADTQDAKPWLTRIAEFQGKLPRGAIDDVAARQLHEIFAGEAFELVQKLESAAADWAAAPTSAQPPADLKFASHTLLGAALMSNCQPIATATRAIRDRVDEAIAQSAVPDAAFFAHLARVFEGLFQFLDGYREGKIENDGNDLALRVGGLAFTGEDMPPPAIPPAPVAAEMPEAPPAAPAEPEFLSLAGPDASDEELQGIFLSEGQDLLQSLDAYSEAWEQAPYAEEPQAEIRRVLHTLKGSARMAGYGGISDIAHRLETLLDEATRDGAPGGTFFARLHFASDGLHHILDDLARGQPADTASLLTELETPLRAPQVAAAAPATFAAAPAEEEVIEMSMPEPESPEPVAAAEPEPVPAPQAAAIEVTPLAEMPVAGPDADLAEIFNAEAAELIEGLGHALDRWQSDPHDDAAMRDMQRALHTLKGGARMASLNAMGTAAHEMEERIEAIEQGRVQADGDTFAQLRAELEQLQTMQDLLARGDTAALTAERFVAPVAVAPVVVPEAVAAPAPAAADRGPWDPELFWRPEQEGAGAGALRRETARVAVEQLDSMLNQAGEISIYRSRLEEHNSGVAAQLNEMAAAIQRLREQLRMLDIETEAQIAARGLGPADSKDQYESEFDPLEMDRYTRMQELSRALSESVGDLANLHSSMDELVGEGETLLLQQGRINTQVQQGLMSTLMVPFSRQAARLQRVVKQTAQSEGKLAELSFEGIESELDRNVLERMTAPLEHLLRNAVVHGIERPEERMAAGKPESGHVVVGLRREGTQLLIELRDDGQGLNLKAIRDQAIKRGLMPADAQVADDALAQFIFEPGFSTAKALTQAAGRGIGMDVVASEVKQLGGSLELGSEPGKGARFLIRLPLNLAISQALLVGVGAEFYAVSLPSVEGIARIPRERLDELYAEGGPGFSYGGHDYRVHYLGDFMGIARDREREQKTVSAILVRVPEGLGAQERRIAVTVDQLLGNREIVSKSVGPQVSSVMGVSGATILADGRVILILDVAALTQERLRRTLITAAAAVAPGAAEAVNAPAAPAAPAVDAHDLIMVVDDSVTIRRVTERLLLKNGFRVVTAKDGLDAMAKLQTESPAVILLDIEMPRADGFEVAAFVRNNERIARTPIIMITSRSGEKHRERARSIGVNRYMIKPYQEEQLVAEIASVKVQA